MLFKGHTYTQGVGIMEILWKVVESIIDTLINAVVTFYNVLHRLCANRGTGSAIMELNMAQELASIEQNPLFMVLLDLRKAYDTL